MSVLQNVAPQPTELIWVTQNNLELANHWTQQNAVRDIRVVAQTPGDVTAAIVANSPHQHVSTARELITRGVHTFCEKPLALRTDDAAELIRLAQSNEVRLGVELVLHYACYAHEFANQIRSLKFDRIEMDWHDPWSEERHGEIKQGSLFTYMTDDMLPHCWSLLRLIAGSPMDCDVEKVDYTMSATKIHSKHTKFDSVVSLSRRSERGRVREIRVYQTGHTDPVALLDFSTEPGFSEVGKRTH